MTAVLAMAFVFSGDIASVANFNYFTLFLTFIVVNAAVMVLRYNRPMMNRPFPSAPLFRKSPLLPAFGIAFNAFLLLKLSREVMAVGAGLAILVALASFGPRNQRRA